MPCRLQIVQFDQQKVDVAVASKPPEWAYLHHFVLTLTESAQQTDHVGLEDLTSGLSSLNVKDLKAAIKHHSESTLGSLSEARDLVTKTSITLTS